MDSDFKMGKTVDADELRRMQEQFERELLDAERLSRVAHSRAVSAFRRLLTLAETRDSGQIGRVAQFIAATYNGGFHFNLFELRVLDREIGDDMLACLDCLRWATSDLYKLVPNGMDRVEKVITDWGLRVSIEN